MRKWENKTESTNHWSDSVSTESLGSGGSGGRRNVDAELESIVASGEDGYLSGCSGGGRKKKRFKRDDSNSLDDAGEENEEKFVCTEEVIHNRENFQDIGGELCSEKIEMKDRSLQRKTDDFGEEELIAKLRGSSGRGGCISGINNNIGEEI